MTAGDEPRDDLAAARGGDSDALVRLLERATPAVKRAVSADLPRRWGHLLSVEDVLQQACVDAFRDVASFEGTDQRAFSAWLTRIAKRNLLDAVRMLEAEKRGGGRLVRAPRDHETASIELLAHLTQQTSPSRAATREELAAALQAALAELPDDYRGVISAFDLAGRDMSEVADELGRSRGAAYMIRARALRLLRERLGSTQRFFSTGA